MGLFPGDFLGDALGVGPFNSSSLFGGGRRGGKVVSTNVWDVPGLGPHNTRETTVGSAGGGQSGGINFLDPLGLFGGSGGGGGGLPGFPSLPGLPGLPGMPGMGGGGLGGGGLPGLPSGGGLPGLPSGGGFPSPFGSSGQATGGNGLSGGLGGTYDSGNGAGAVGSALEMLFGSFTPGQVPPRSLYQEAANTVDAYRRTAPDIYALEAEYRPKYANLERGILTDTVRNLTSEGAGADPRQAALLGEMNRQALSELQMGAQLDPSLAREVQQSVRAGQSARGLGLGPADVYQEAMQIGSAGQAMRNQRRAFAGNVAAVNLENLRPYLALAQTMTRATPTYVDQWNPYASDLYNTNYNAEAARQIAAAANRTSVAGSTLEAIGNIVGGLI